MQEVWGRPPSWEGGVSLLSELWSWAYDSLIFIFFSKRKEQIKPWIRKRLVICQTLFPHRSSQLYKWASHRLTWMNVGARTVARAVVVQTTSLWATSLQWWMQGACPWSLWRPPSALSAPVLPGTESISLVPPMPAALVSMVGCVLTLWMVTGEETSIAPLLLLFLTTSVASKIQHL